MVRKLKKLEKNSLENVSISVLKRFKLSTHGSEVGKWLMFSSFWTVALNLKPGDDDLQSNIPFEACST